MLKPILIAFVLAIFAFAQNAAAQFSKEKPVAVKLADFKKKTSLLELMSKNANFDKSACQITDFTMYKERPNLDPIELKSVDDKFKDVVATAIKTAKKGDRFTFVLIKGKCQGDLAKRQLSDIVIEIK